MSIWLERTEDSQDRFIYEQNRKEWSFIVMQLAVETEKALDSHHLSGRKQYIEHGKLRLYK